MYILIFLSILIPQRYDLCIISGEVKCLHQKIEYYTDEDGDVSKSYVPGSTETTENIFVYLVRQEECGSYLPIHERIKYAEQKYVTKEGGRYYFYTQPEVTYRVYFVVGPEQYQYATVVSRSGSVRVRDIRLEVQTQD